MPTVVSRPNLQRVCCGNQVVVRLFGRPDNWNLGQLRYKRGRAGLLQKIAAIGQEGLKNVERILAPDARKFNARLVEAEALSEEIFVNKRLSLFRGAQADGVVIPHHSAFWISSGDCPTVVIFDQNQDRLIVAHAGRDCLIDRSIISDNRRSRPHSSVIETLKDKVDPANTKTFITCGIGPNSYIHNCHHPKFGGFNVEMFKFLTKHFGSRVCRVIDKKRGLWSLDLPFLIKVQLSQIGIDQVDQDRIDTYRDTDTMGRFLWHSHSRSRDLGQVSAPPERNAIVVCRSKDD